MIIALIIIASILGYLAMGGVSSRALRTKAADLCISHYVKWPRSSPYYYRSDEWTPCPGATCQHPEWSHRLTRTSFEGWMVGLTFLWPVFVPALLRMHASQVWADKFDPMTQRARDIRVSYLEQTELTTIRDIDEPRYYRTED